MVYVRKSSKRCLKPLTLMIEVMEVCPREGHVRRCRGNQSVDCWAEIRLRLLGRLQTRTNLLYFLHKNTVPIKLLSEEKLPGKDIQVASDQNGWIIREWMGLRYPRLKDAEKDKMAFEKLTAILRFKDVKGWQGYYDTTLSLWCYWNYCAV